MRGAGSANGQVGIANEPGVLTANSRITVTPFYATGEKVTVCSQSPEWCEVVSFVSKVDRISRFGKKDTEYGRFFWIRRKSKK
jgi:hypothetical protein